MPDASVGRRFAGVVVGGLGAVTFAFHANRLLTAELPLLALLFGIALPMAVAATLVGVGLWLARSDAAPRPGRVVSWTLAGALLEVALAAATGVFQQAVGGEAVFELQVLAVHATVGGLLGVLLGVYDGQRVLTRRRLRSERETATRLTERLSVLNRVLRHDIRNRVSVIRGNADLIANGGEGVETAAESIRRQADDLQQLSDYARELQAVLGSDEVETEPVDVGTLVRAKVMRLREDHEYATVTASVAESAWASASPFVDSAIENVLENAVEHNDRTEPSVWVDVETARRNGNQVVTVRVADDGPGIPDEELSVLQRGRETALEHASGLGLWLVHWTVTGSGGEIEFEAREPRGSVVEVTLPGSTPPEDSEPAE